MLTDKKQQKISYLTVIGCFMVFQASITKPTGPLTRALNIFENFAGAGCCLTALILSAKKDEPHDQGKK
jgi:hypothetical protein